MKYGLMSVNTKQTKPNIQHSTSNIQHPTKPTRARSAPVGYDLDDRLLDYAARIVRLAESLPKTRSGNHIAGQLLRSGTSALANHAEAQAAESKSDFLHKMRICLKELRESYRWLLLCKTVPLIKPASKFDPIVKETDELAAIFFTSIRSAKARPDD